MASLVNEEWLQLLWYCITEMSTDMTPNMQLAKNL
uniref:Uncharacterized protein n=1 Tax=Arundo donax TaxID=35708 RepID=A0A0A9FGT1_ARUDO